MARNRKKVYEQGDRINIYLSRDLTPEFVEWINTQSDLSNFFLYAAQQLYQQTGFVDVSEVMPRKINFELTSADKTPPQFQTEASPIPEIKKETVEPENQKNDNPSQSEEPGRKEEESTWSKIDLDDDPYA